MVKVLSDPKSEEVRSEVLGAIKGLAEKHPLEMGYAEI